jgi:hypothetical protein
VAAPLIVTASLRRPAARNFRALAVAGLAKCSCYRGVPCEDVLAQLGAHLDRLAHRVHVGTRTGGGADCPDCQQDRHRAPTLMAESYSTGEGQ